ncbi:MAG TPA: hypothetical protein VFC25_10145 [Verrucomicrobiae bacterium]|nr:hypothetical protein [Verrucomicrobiae bacterium]
MIRKLYLETAPWVVAEKSVGEHGTRIACPERAFPRFKKKSSKGPVPMSREFDQSMLDGFACIDAAVHAVRELGASSVEILALPKLGKRPDALAIHPEGNFPIEAKRVRADAGFYKLQDEVDGRRALDPQPLARPSLRVTFPFPLAHGGLERLSDQGLVIIGEAFAEMARRWTKGGRITETCLLPEGLKLTLEVSDGLGPGQLIVMGTGGLIEPLDTSWLEKKVAVKVREAKEQLAAWHQDGATRHTGLAFIKAEFPEHMIFHRDEAERRIIEAGTRAGKEAGVRVKVTCTWS